MHKNSNIELCKVCNSETFLFAQELDWTDLRSEHGQQPTVLHVQCIQHLPTAVNVISMLYTVVIQELYYYTIYHYIQASYYQHTSQNVHFKSSWLQDPKASMLMSALIHIVCLL